MGSGQWQRREGRLSASGHWREHREPLATGDRKAGHQNISQERVVKTTHGFAGRVSNAGVPGAS